MSDTTCRAQFTAADIAAACGGRPVSGPTEVAARGVSTDSRTIQPGQAFVALHGERHDGHTFVPDALRKGASVAVVDRVEPGWNADDATLVEVEDTGDALLNLARLHRDRLNAAVAGVTGSCGKSTIKNMLAAILGQEGPCTAAPSSFNNRVGVPLTLLDADVNDRFVVCEMGANAPGEIDELAACARPDGAIVSCIGDCHLEGFGGREGVRDAKGEIVPYITDGGTLVLNRDDELCMTLKERHAGPVRTFGFTDDASVTPRALERRDGSWVFRARGETFHLSAPGRYNVANAAAAMTLALSMGCGMEAVKEGLAQVSLPPMRYDTSEICGVTIVEDCYNSNPTAARAAVDAFLDEPVAGRRAVVFGDMLELGQRAAELHRDMGEFLAKCDIQLLIAVGQHGRDVLDGWNRVASASRQAMHFREAEKAWKPIWDELEAGDGVLLKGSRKVGLERIVNRIQEYVRNADTGAAA
ncbi:MAG: UDP-N-acetylmuramoyl-tripeptide--D-alanyl-D-alanine ligase [Planctomycetota bacterium]